MKKRLFALLLLPLLSISMLYAQAQEECENSTALIQLDVNNVSATLGHATSLWNGPYVAPTDFPEIIAQSTLFAGNLWLGGLDLAGNLKVAANTYSRNTGNSDFFPGPLSPTQFGSTDPATCLNFDRFWTVRQTEIDAFQQDFDDNGQIDGAHPNVYSWPGRGNPESLAFNGFELPDQALAPFIDNNGDNRYNPNDGDYPSIYGDEAIWWVFNDAGNIHFSSLGDPISAEVQVMAYAFESEIEAVNNATFYDFKIINRAVEPIDSFFAGIWLDLDLGCPIDDYVGCIPEENLSFVYNADADDGVIDCICPQGIDSYCEDIPLFGLKLLRGPLNEIGEELGMSSFIALRNEASATEPEGTIYPQTAVEYYNYLSGSWRDGSPITSGGEGYMGEGPDTKFLFPGNPADENAWSMCQEELEVKDRQTLSSIGPLKLDPGAIISFCFAMLWVPNVEHPCPDVSPLIEAGNTVEEFCSAITTTSIAERNLPASSIRQYPSPMSQSARIELVDERLQIQDFQLFDAMGREMKPELSFQSNALEIKRSNLAPGLYFYRLRTHSGKLASGKLVIQ